VKELDSTIRHCDPSKLAFSGLECVGVQTPESDRTSPLERSSGEPGCTSTTLPINCKMRAMALQLQRCHGPTTVMQSASMSHCAWMSRVGNTICSREGTYDGWCSKHRPCVNDLFKINSSKRPDPLRKLLFPNANQIPKHNSQEQSAQLLLVDPSQRAVLIGRHTDLGVYPGRYTGLCVGTSTTSWVSPRGDREYYGTWHQPKHAKLIPTREALLVEAAMLHGIRLEAHALER